ncbi:division/cell wall cluster transcriptional repressor MraZ [Gramella sp. GC03-9]|uniref:Transcriptional regulator MraZ n=1 Tax=Christiangramia oceanisediminis TaxID=2920386 RepID=A0A9X2L088_9FLAO|nr:division/cell wall cluster transcriptional repressor MraZ [Gramella oceanisediminis]MCP9201477.1 division/cell wall cluster transcriptional repressor MraZ [Gramella oceanisediminis]
MINLIGTYECKVDAKGRMMVPSALKKQLAPAMQHGFVIKRSVFQNCLELYPMDQWNGLMAKMNKLNRFKKKNNDFIRKFTAGVKTVEVDTNGRLLIPRDLVGFAGIEKEIVLSSAINIVEIWDKDKYEQSLEDSPEDFAELAEEVMGNDDFDFDGVS